MLGVFQNGDVSVAGNFWEQALNIAVYQVTFRIALLKNYHNSDWNRFHLNVLYHRQV